MKTTKLKSYLVLILMTIFGACSDNAFQISGDDSANVENETSTDAYFDDVDDMSALALAADDATLNGGKTTGGGRKILVNDGRFACDGVVIEINVDESSTPDKPKGTVSIDFGEGCTDARGNIRKGVIVISYEGRRFFPGSTWTLTFVNYEINGIKLEGIRMVTNKSESKQDNPIFNIQLVDGKATWPDGTFATREVNITREWVRANNPLEDSWLVTGSAIGSNRRGVDYSMEITKPLVYRRACAVANRIHIAVEGTKVLTTGNRQIIIDYGDGDCDRKVSVTINGETVERIVNGD